MKWSDVGITDENDKVHSGSDALRFVEDKCKPLAINTNWDGFIVVNTNSPSASTEDKEVRSFLFSKLKGKAKSLKFTKGKKFQRETLPLARAVPNVVIVNPARLKVEFIYKQDPRSGSKIYLKDPVVSVTVDFAGNRQSPASTIQKDAPQGVVDLGAIPTGKYTLTPDYSKLEPCKFDFEVKPQDIYLDSGENKLVIFEVEPLYQKVQLIAHCLLAIPDRVYHPASGETLHSLDQTDLNDPEQPPKMVLEGTLNGQWKGKYHGLLSDWDDINARVNLVKATMEYAHTKAKDDQTILKVFMLPECFFQGRYGAYLVEDADHLLTQLLNLSGEVKWRDWVFVFGTVNFTFGQDIREMMNYSPVIRGGLGPAGEASGSGGQSDKHLRLIQKLINSAELLDASEIIHHDKERRIPSVNDAVQFQANQSEEEVGEILRKLLHKDHNFKERTDSEYEDPDFGARHGLTHERWAEVKAEFEKKVKELGLTRVVRYIRGCDTEGLTSVLSGWGDFSGYQDRTQAHREPKILVNVAWKGLILKFIKDGYNSYFVRNPLVRAKPNPNLPPPAPPLFVKGWKLDAITGHTVSGADLRKLIITDIQKRLDELIQPFEITLSYQKEILREEIKKLLVDREAIQFVEANQNITIPEKFGASVYPMWKKLLELYCAEKKIAGVSLNPDPKKMDYRDYCFASHRKAGPWLTLEEAESLEPCKKLVFGLEICADHANRGGRIKNALIQQKIPDDADLITREKMEKLNASKSKVKLDIQMVPSAGFFPNDNAIAARNGGYCFNCDGWNKGSNAPGVNFITEWFDGPYDSNANPVTPHTAIAKGGEGVLRDMTAFKPERVKLPTVIDPALGIGILSEKGLGELHIYAEVDLPK